MGVLHRIVFNPDKIDMAKSNKGSVDFDERLNSYFKSSVGAYSEATKMEGDEKRQYNVKATQRKILEVALGKELLVRKGKGGKSSLENLGIKATSTMRVYPSGQKIEVTLVYPKKYKNELRIYFSGATFKANAHDFILIYIRGGEPWIGTISEVSLRLITASPPKIYDLTPREEKLEEEIDDYQSAINRKPKLVEKNTNAFAWKRDAKIAKETLESSGFKCELFPDQITFTSKSTGNPFMEVHHLVPMKLQSSFSTNLDVKPNLCILNPTAHRLLHHAKYDELKPHLKKLVSTREKFLSEIGVDWGYMESIYK